MSTLEYVFPHLECIVPILTDPTVSEVMVIDGGERVFAERNGRIDPVVGVSIRSDVLRHAIEQMAKDCRLVVDDASPMLEARLDGGDRISACLDAVGGAILSVRRFGQRFSLETLLQIQAMNEDQYAAISDAVDAGLNILVSGGTGAGKSTLIMGMLDRLPIELRILLIESTSELTHEMEAEDDVWNRPHIVRMQERPFNRSTGEPAITIADRLKHALRHRPDRIILGEVRQQEAFDLLQVLNTGHRGSFSSIHANSTRHALRRLARLAVSDQRGLSEATAFEDIKDSLQVVVHMERQMDGTRRVVDVLDVERDTCV